MLQSQARLDHSQDRGNHCRLGLVGINFDNPRRMLGSQLIKGRMDGFVKAQGFFIQAIDLIGPVLGAYNFFQRM